MIDDGQSFPEPSVLRNRSKSKPFLTELGFEDWELARNILRRLEISAPSGFTASFPFLISALGSAANLDRSLMNFERYLEAYGQGFFPELSKNPRVIEILVKLFSNSPFLTEILLQTPKAIELLNHRRTPD